MTVNGGKYSMDAVQTPELSLEGGDQLILNMSDSTMDMHPVLFSTGPDGTYQLQTQPQCKTKRTDCLISSMSVPVT